MTVRRSVVLNGDLGSGKTTVSILLAKRLGIRRISVGDLYRTMAAERGMTALQLNLHAELDDKIDHYVDQLQSDIAASGERLIVDSRLAWHFFTDAIKIHLVVDATAAARRVLGRPADEVESYASIEQARAHLASRGNSERTRFISRYGVDKTRLRNYDIVCDSTSAGPGGDRRADRRTPDGTAALCPGTALLPRSSPHPADGQRCARRIGSGRLRGARFLRRRRPRSHRGHDPGR
jgi:cytidylate kinase